MAKQSTSARARRRRASRSSAAKARQQRSGRLMWIAIVIVVVIGVALAVAARGDSKTAAPRSPAPAALVAKVTSIPADVSAQVGAGTAKAFPKAISAPALNSGGKPRVVYMGAEYCPYCATERWAMVIALSRFGKFSGLSTTTSSSIDTFPSTHTFSFYGSTYSSPYLVFEPVELNTNQVASDGGYKKLETPSAEQQQLMNTYDAPPYVSATSNGAIPFIDFGGKYMISGATYDAAVLQGKSSDEIATALSDPTTAISQGAVGAANTMTAALCNLTGDKPAATCSNPTIQGLKSRLG